jgi:serine phosphatase RsbU (regulator of sigma subunit)
MRLERALVLGTMLIVLSAGVGMLGALITALRVDLERREFDALETDQRVLARLLEHRRESLQNEARLLAEEPRIRAVAGAADISAETVVEVLSDVRRSTNLSDLQLFDGHGASLAVTGTLAVSRALVDRALDGQVAARLQGPVLVAASPVMVGEDLVGVVVAAREVLDAWVEEAHAQTGAVFVVVDATRGPLAWAPRATIGVQEAQRAVASARTDDGYLALERPLDAAEYRVVAARSWAEVRKPLFHLAALLGLTTLLAAGLLAIPTRLIARRVARPMERLVDIARAVASGAAQVQPPPSRVEEVAILGDAMRQMAVDLAAGREAELRSERLQREVNIAERIQRTILPPDLRLPNMEVAARMVPASEVGGDYFDVLADADGGWLAVGDVTGHGLPAGLIMLMTQTGTAAIATREAEDPRAVVVGLNRLLHDNIRLRMKRDDHVTYTLFRYQRSGRMTFAGAHEPIVIWRRRTGRCEILETPGTWLGAVPSLERIAVTTELQLESGDVLVLHTDGITESMNPARERFGLERLVDCVEADGAAPVEAICGRIFAAVEGWAQTQEDDRTILVARYVAGTQQPVMATDSGSR